MVSHHPVKFASNRYCGGGDMLWRLKGKIPMFSLKFGITAYF